METKEEHSKITNLRANSNYPDGVPNKTDNKEAQKAQITLQGTHLSLNKIENKAKKVIVETSRNS